MTLFDFISTHLDFISTLFDLVQVPIKPKKGPGRRHLIQGAQGPGGAAPQDAEMYDVPPGPGSIFYIDLVGRLS